MNQMPLSLSLAVLSFMMTVIWGGPLLRILRHFKVGKVIRVEEPDHHAVKMGTPTMGGVMFIAPVLLLTLLLNASSLFGVTGIGRSILIPLIVMVAYAVLGAVDDWEGIRGPRRGEGMRSRTKFMIQVLLALITAWALKYLLQVPELYLPGYEQVKDHLQTDLAVRQADRQQGNPGFGHGCVSQDAPQVALENRPDAAGAHHQQANQAQGVCKLSRIAQPGVAIHETQAKYQAKGGENRQDEAYGIGGGFFGQQGHPGIEGKNSQEEGKAQSKQHGGLGNQPHVAGANFHAGEQEPGKKDEGHRQGLIDEEADHSPSRSLAGMNEQGHSEQHGHLDH